MLVSKKFLLIIPLSLLVLAFQNCAQPKLLSGSLVGPTSLVSGSTGSMPEISKGTGPTPADLDAAAMLVSWTRCAGEQEMCNFSGAKTVRFGVPGHFSYGNYTDHIYCSAATFGDPIWLTAKNCEVSSSPVVVVMGPMSSALVNLLEIPVGSMGSATPITSINSPDTIDYTRTGIDNGEFRISCGFSHMNFDDPLVFPGQKGKAHLHAFFGNTLTDFASTAESIASSGNSTCQGGTLNRTAYWVPAIINVNDGVPVKPEGNMNYYKASENNRFVTAPPKGLRMIAGNAKSVGPSAGQKGSYLCRGKDGTMSISGPAIPPNCEPGDFVTRVAFPQCWDGKNLDSANHQSHMAYRAGSLENGCPSTHPILLPNISFNVHYLVKYVGETANWRLSSDSYSSTLPGGYSIHADWFNGWDEATMNLIVNKCLHTGVNCGSNDLPKDDVAGIPEKHMLAPPL